MADDPKPRHPREDGLLYAEERVRKYVELYPYPGIGSKILYDKAFKSEEWPRTAYPLNRADLVEILRDLEIYEEELSKANSRAVRDAKKIAELEEKLLKSRQLVVSMQLNGARHWFSYSHQKCTNVPLSKWVDVCKICEKEKDHPAHFQADAEYLDSRGVEVAVAAAQERLCRVLEDGMNIRATVALNMARELLQGLPGVGDFQAVSGRPEVPPRRCNICPRHEDEHEGADHRFSWGSVPGQRQPYHR